MNLVLAHDYLIQMGGAERVVATVHGAFPEAPLYTSAVKLDGLAKEFVNAEIRTSWMQHLPFIQHHTHFKKYLLLYPAAFRSFGILEAKAAWISCSTFAKFLRFSNATRTVCYLHNTSRFLWQTESYLDHEVRPGVLNSLLRGVLPRLREGDREAAASMKVLLANSNNVRERIRRCYGLESSVLHPPVETGRFEASRSDEGFYLIVSRLLGYKNLGLPVRLFSRTGRRLIVIGEGPHRAALEAAAGGAVQFLGRLSDAEIADYYSRCRALILPGEEDFGITPVEAMACGKPVVAFARGGALETVLDGETGVFFSENSEEALDAAIVRCEEVGWDPIRIRARASEFSCEAFIEKTAAILRAV